MNPTEKIFTAADIASVVGVNPDETTRKQESYSAFNAVHFALVKELADFGFPEKTALEFAFGIGFAASTTEERGTGLIRRSDPASGTWGDGPIWVDLDTHEVAMCAAADLQNINSQMVYLTINVGLIEADVLQRLQALAGHNA